MFKLPFLILCIPFVAGIFVCYNFSVSYNPIAAIIVLLLLFLLLISLYFGFSKAYLGFGILAVLIFLLLGMERMRIKLENLHSSPVFNLLDYPVECLARISDVPEFNSWIRINSKLLYVKDSTGRWIRTGDHIVIYLETQQTITDISPGDIIHCRATLRQVNTRANPYSFDYSKYLFRLGIQFQTFVYADSWKILEDSSTPGSIKTVSLGIREYLLDILSKYVPSDQSNALVSAILLGYKNEISDELYDAFRASGVVHILAVSGLHVGIVSLIIFTILKVVKIQSGFWIGIRSALMVLSIWFYAFLTGLSPSVFRASTMFSLIFAAKSFKNNSNIYNVIAVSAFILLWIDPLLLFQIGFQFSFLAVIGIVFFYPLLSKLISPSSPIIRFIWKSAVVSISAQLLISPLALFYFHQFPIYFWLSSVIAVPAATCILVLGKAIIVFHFLSPALASTIGYLLEKFILFFIYIIEFIQGIPFALLSDIYFDIPLLIIFSVVIACTMLLVTKRNPVWLSILLLCLLIIPVTGIIKTRQFSDYEVYIYDHRTVFLMDFITGRTVYSLYNSGQSGETHDMIAGNNRIHKQIKQIIDLSSNNYSSRNHLRKSGDLIEFGSKVFYIPQELHPVKLFNSDFAIITSRTYYDKFIPFEEFSGTYVIHPSAKEHWRKILPNANSIDMNISGYFSIQYP